MRTLLGPRLGVGFNRLWAASAVSNLGDGVTMVAGPLLLLSVTDNPTLIAGGAIAGQVPWLLFGLVSGAYVDRLDRRRLIIVVNLVRAAALAVLTLTVATGHTTVPLIYAVIFLLGCAETAADTAAGALMPAVVAPEHLDRANARLGATFTVINQFAAKPFGAWLYGIAAAVPFGLDALTFVIAAALVAGLPPVPAAPPAPRRRLRTEIGEGLRWLWRHPVLRATAVAMGFANIVFCAAFAIFVLYARDRLGLSEVGYGLLLTAFAAGGLIGSLIAVPLTNRVGATAVLRADLVAETLVHATLAWTRSPLVAASALVLFSAHGMIWGITIATLRQRIVPPHLLGRVGSVYALLESGGAAAIGSLIGGLLAGIWGLTTPFWLASAAMAAIAAGAWRPLRHATALNQNPAAYADRPSPPL
ncbi:MFS transporter [Actinoplanes aureus]|uniref:MFS transporter n=1 Tax=Actinoplanes aureus TaxID=2792083 RepID=A0A931G6N4_9ACTN|nr:MFS transporter [Actinoplanes aureus]MBG0567404.1 MFS transporter [Actinoplanes aureus]